jgi:hypothetical protein
MGRESGRRWGSSDAEKPLTRTASEARFLPAAAADDTLATETGDYRKGWEVKL